MKYIDRHFGDQRRLSQQLLDVQTRLEQIASYHGPSDIWTPNDPDEAGMVHQLVLEAEYIRGRLRDQRDRELDQAHDEAA